MNRLTLATALLLAIPLMSGCIGYPPDAVRPGDSVEVHYEAYDLATGETLARNQTATITIGGDAPLGNDVGAALVGKRMGETVRIESRKDAGRQFTETVRASRLIVVLEDVHQTIPRDEAPRDVAVGKSYPYGRLVATITSVNATEVTFDVSPPAQAHDEIASLGLSTTLEVRGRSIVNVIDALADRPAFAGPLSPLLDRPGTYRVRAVEGDELVFDRSPVANPDLVGRDVRFEVTLGPIHHDVPAVHPGEYGHRLSPQLGRSTGTQQPALHG